MPLQSSSRKNSERLADFKNIFPSDIVAFVSNRSIDFARKGDVLTLSDKQRRFLSRSVGEKVSSLPNIKQVHGKRIVVVKGTSGWPFKADGLITQKPGIPLTVRTADCLSIFIFDPKSRAIGLVHAGWRGTQKKIALRAIELMKKNWGTCPQDLRIVFGPSIKSCCYEVGNEFKKYFLKEISRRDGRLFLDLNLANRRQLLKAGVRKRNIYDCGICSACDARCHSFRRDGEKSGRMLSFMMLKD